MRILLVLMALFLVGCSTAQPGDVCHELWADCPGVAEDYNISYSAYLVKEYVVLSERFYVYHNCKLGIDTPTLIIGAECALVTSDPR